MAAFILCAGMRRSGSTLQYNIVKRVLEISGKGKTLGYAESPEIEKIIGDYIDKDGYYAIKVHDFFSLASQLNSSGKLKVIFSYRDIRDIIVSSMHKWQNGSFKNTYSKVFVELLKKSYYDWMILENVYCNSYEKIMISPLEEAKNIVKYLDIDLPDTIIELLVKDLDFETLKRQLNVKSDFEKTIHGEIEKDTLLHKNHLRSGEIEQWKSELTDMQIAIIQKEWKDWLSFNGYKIHKTPLNNSFYFLIYTKWLWRFIMLRKKIKRRMSTL